MKMKRFWKLFSFTMAALLTSSFFVSCERTTATNSGNEAPTDSTIAMLQMIDSLKSSGVLYHLEYWVIGEIGGYKPATIYVNKLSVEKDTLFYVSIEKDCSSYYSSSFEQAIIDVSEIKYFRAAIDEIKKNLTRETDHGEMYTYCSKSNAMLRGTLFKDKSKPVVKFFVNSRNENSVLYFDLVEYDLDKLRSLLDKAEKKLIEVREKGNRLDKQ